MARKMQFRFQVMASKDSLQLQKSMVQTKKILTFPRKGNILNYNGKLSEKLKSFHIWEIGYPDDCIAMIAVF